MAIMRILARRVWPAKILAGIIMAGISGGCGGGDPNHQVPSRDLFEALAEASTTGFDRPYSTTSTTITDLDFDNQRPEHVWVLRHREAKHFEIANLKGDEQLVIEGGRLSYQPEAATAGGHLLLVFPSSEMSRVRLSGRLRLGAGEGSSTNLRRIALIYEHRGPVENLVRLRPQVWTRRDGMDAKCKAGRAGWCRFELEWVTGPATRSIELQLAVPSTGGTGSSLDVDEISFSCKPMTVQAVTEYLATTGRSRPFSTAGLTILRADLQLPDNSGGESRDAVLLPPETSLTIPVNLPAAGNGMKLRFHTGMWRGARQPPEGELQIAVSFEDGRGEPEMLALAPVGGHGQNVLWRETVVTLAGVAGRKGAIRFATRWLDAADSRPPVPVLLATPRIEVVGSEPDRFNVLLIGVDTLRPDRMSLYGYPRPTTPHLEDLASDALLFAEARSQAPWSLPSFATLLTSQYPSSHRAGLGGRGRWTGVSDRVTTLAEVLSKAGYRTAGVVANTFLSPAYGLDRGFAAYRWSTLHETALRDAEIVSGLVATPSREPWFVFWHIMDPHLPYSTPPEFHRQFVDPEYSGRFAPVDPNEQVPYKALVGLRRDRDPGGGPTPAPELSAEDRRFIEDCYDAELAEMDAAIGKVLAALKSSDRWDRTVIALAADHGEGFGEHGHYHHGYTLYDDQVKIPMMIRIPGRSQARVIEDSVGNIDLAPTILEAVSLESPADFQGIGQLSPGRRQRAGLILESPTYDGSPVKAFVGDRFKVVAGSRSVSRSLFDLREDPAEQNDVSTEHLEFVARAVHEIDRHAWVHTQAGYYHVRVSGVAGRELHLELTTTGLFDANVAVCPEFEAAVTNLDLDRRRLTIEGRAELDTIEATFWFRGRTLGVQGTADGAAVAVAYLDGFVTGPLQLQRDSINQLEGQPPAIDPKEPVMRVWFNRGQGEAHEVLSSSEDLDRLRALGYIDG